eukprot:gene9007-9180_t
MKAAVFALFCALALASAQALSQSDVDNFLETAELAAVGGNRDLLQDAQGTPGAYGYAAAAAGSKGVVEAAVAGGSTCEKGKATLYTASSTRMCVISSLSDKTGTIYNGVDGKISTSTGATCIVTACPAGTTVASSSATSSATTSSTSSTSHPFFGLNHLFGGKRRSLTSISNRKLLGTNFFFPFFSVPFLSQGAPSTSSTTAASTASVSSTYYSAQCYTVCE